MKKLLCIAGLSVIILLLSGCHLHQTDVIYPGFGAHHGPWVGAHGWHHRRHLRRHHNRHWRRHHRHRPPRVIRHAPASYSAGGGRRVGTPAGGGRRISAPAGQVRRATPPPRRTGGSGYSAPARRSAGGGRRIN